MSFPRLSLNYLTFTIFSQSSEATGFPATNIINVDRPFKAWRSTVTTASEIVVNMGAVQTNLTVLLTNVNFDDVSYEESADGSTGFVALATNVVIEKDPVWGVYSRVDDLVMTSKQYLKIKIDSQTPVDSASYFKIGSFAVLTSTTTLTADNTFGLPFTYREPAQAVLSNVFSSGAQEDILLSANPPLVISTNIVVSASQNIKGTDLQTIVDLIRASATNIFVDFNLGESWQAYNTKRASTLQARMVSPRTGEVSLGEVALRVNR